MKPLLALLPILTLPILMLPACSSREGDDQATQAASPESSAESSAAATRPAATPTGPARVSRYTRLDGCKLERRSAPDEGDFADFRCPALAGFRIKLSEDDLRQNLHVARPGQGAETSLKLSEATGRGGFSRLGDVLEWRGSEQGGEFRPDALVLRYRVVEDPERPGRETAYLLAVSLAGDRPCVTAMIPPGPGQNDQARAKADEERSCL